MGPLLENFLEVVSRQNVLSSFDIRCINVELLYSIMYLPPRLFFYLAFLPFEPYALVHLVFEL